MLAGAWWISVNVYVYVYVCTYIYVCVNRAVVKLMFTKVSINLTAHFYDPTFLWLLSFGIEYYPNVSDLNKLNYAKNW